MGFNEFKELWAALNAWKENFMTIDQDRSGTVEHHELTQSIAIMGKNINILCNLYRFSGYIDQKNLNYFHLLSNLGIFFNSSSLIWFQGDRQTLTADLTKGIFIVIIFQKSICNVFLCSEFLLSKFMSVIVSAHQWYFLANVLRSLIWNKGLFQLFINVCIIISVCNRFFFLFYIWQNT